MRSVLQYVLIPLNFFLSGFSFLMFSMCKGYDIRVAGNFAYFFSHGSSMIGLCLLLPALSSLIPLLDFFFSY